MRCVVESGMGTASAQRAGDKPCLRVKLMLVFVAGQKCMCAPLQVLEGVDPHI